MDSRGITLIEMLLTIVIISTLTAITLPMYQSLQLRTNIGTTTEQVTNMYRRAQVYARGMRQDSTWSVRLVTGSATLYKGSTYATRDATQDETMSLPSNFAISGLTAITFAKLTGLPSTTGTTVFTLSPTETRTISINAKGMVNY